MNITTKSDIVEQIANETMLSKDVVNIVITSFVNQVPVNLKRGNKVILRGLGCFIPRHMKEKKAQDMAQKKTIVVPAHDVVKFKSYIEL